MAKLSLTNILGQYASTTQLNNNFTAIETALENTLSRDGTTPNTMSADLDMNSKDINNASVINTDSLVVAGSSVVAGDTLTVPSATNVPNTPAGSISSTNVQDALNELDTDITTLDTEKAIESEYISVAVAGTDTYTATVGITTYTTNKTYFLSFTNTNTVVAPTLNLDSLGAKTIKNTDGGALLVGEIPVEALIRYDGTDMILLNHALPDPLIVTNIQSKTALTPPVIKDLNGVEIGQLSKAWVNFNGTGTVAIRDSFNVASITDNDIGNYTINFTNNMPDANYSVSTATDQTGVAQAPVTQLSSSFVVITRDISTASADAVTVCASVHSN